MIDFLFSWLKNVYKNDNKWFIVELGSVDIVCYVYKNI